MEKVTLHNSFHGTKVTILVDDKLSEMSEREIYLELQGKAYGVLHPKQNDVRKLRRIDKTLCGIMGCQCGTVR